MKWITACFRTRLFASQGLPAGGCITDPRDNAVPLALLGGRVVDQYAVHEPPGKVATVVPNFPVAGTGHDEEPWCHPLVYNVRGRVHLCKKHSRRISGAVWNRLDSQICTSICGQKGRPYPLSGCPASLLKIVIGKSTFAPVSGTAYFCQPKFWAAATAGMASRQETIKIFRIPRCPSVPIIK